MEFIIPVSPTYFPLTPPSSPGYSPLTPPSSIGYSPLTPPPSPGYSPPTPPQPFCPYKGLYIVDLVSDDEMDFECSRISGSGPNWNQNYLQFDSGFRGRTCSSESSDSHAYCSDSEEVDSPNYVLLSDSESEYSVSSYTPESSPEQKYRSEPGFLRGEDAEFCVPGFLEGEDAEDFVSSTDDELVFEEDEDSEEMEEETEELELCPDFGMVRKSRVRLNWYQKFQVKKLVQRAFIGKKRSFKNRDPSVPNKKQRT